jgi:hypothetical protein
MFSSIWAKIIALMVALAAVIGACVYIYHQGKSAGIDIANTKIARYEKKIEDLNIELAKKEIIVREKVITEYHTREIVRTQVEYKNRDIIHTVVPEQYRLSKGWVYAHDQSALGLEINPSLAADPTPSNISDRNALNTVTENYNNTNRMADQLEALEKYIRDIGLKVTNENPNNPK